VESEIESLKQQCEDLQSQIGPREAAARQRNRLLLADPAILYEKWKRYGPHSALDDRSFRKQRQKISEIGHELGELGDQWLSDTFTALIEILTSDDAISDGRLESLKRLRTLLTRQLSEVLPRREELLDSLDRATSELETFVKSTRPSEESKSRSLLSRRRKK
jgi:hypothetical protein